MEKIINCCVFIEPDDCANSLTDLLSVFKTLKVAACIKNQSEALELLNKRKIDILFINVDYADFLQLVHKPTFIIGICDQKHSKHLIKYLRQGFFDFLLSPIQKEELYNVVGKALNTYGTYNFLCREKALEANENEILYNKTLLEKTLFTKDSMFLNGPRKSDSLRISFDDVLYLKLEQGNTILYFENGTTKQLHTTLKYFQKKLPSEKFQKINRNIIVNIDKVSRISKNEEVWIGTQPLKVSRSFKKTLKAVLDI